MVKVTNIKKKVSRQVSGFTPTPAATPTVYKQKRKKTGTLLLLLRFCILFYNISIQK